MDRLSDATMVERVDALVEAFRTVDIEMRTLPIYNPALSVEAVGFRAFGTSWVGVVITPWFMSLVALPHGADALHGEAVGDKASWTFPSGDYGFLLGEVGAGLRYWACHLFSPMADFQTQDKARQAAEGALAALFAPPPEEGGEPIRPDDTLEDAEAEAASPKAVGRRGFLTGRKDGDDR